VSFHSQAVNFWKILVLNDEHTERKYVFYFLIGWGEYHMQYKHRCMLGEETMCILGRVCLIGSTNYIKVLMIKI